MYRHKKSILFISLALVLMLLLAACTGSGGEVSSNVESAAADVAAQPEPETGQVGEETAVPPPVTEVEEAAPDPEPGIITGVAYMMAPPTPAMTIYALDPATGKWATMDMEASDSMSTFSLSVEPGSYQIFSSMGLGHASEDGWSLALVTVAAGQTVADIEVRPPSPSDCGPMFGIPASPDGQFVAIPGPTEDCKASVMNGSVQTTTDGPFQPLDDGCTNLQIALEPALQIPFAIEEVPIYMSWTGQTGSGCQLVGLGNGNNFENVIIPHEAAKNVLFEHGWSESMTSPCLGYGGAGPLADHSCFVRSNETCETFVHAEPVDNALCENIDGPINNCMDTLTPEQIIHNIVLTCALDSTSSAHPENSPVTQQIPLELLQGATDTTVHNSLQPEGLHDYVFYAQEGQEMLVSVYATIDGVEAPASAVLDIGVKGYEPLSTYALEWSGVLPATGEYYIDVKAMADVPVDYALYVQILPLEGPVVSDTTGAVSGGIAYPDSYVPLLHIVAFNQNNDEWHWIGAKENSFGYTFPDLPPGQYHIIAFSQNELVGAYASAGDGEPILVTVEAGKTTEGIDIFMWLDRDNPHFPGTSDPVGW
ncbi:MAG: hypothetical protein DWQ04_17785 [Chloroflexi bacterium]|nr:MAG: hypothetical protein DWQ04_17785 [Chloroflexota bacterium]